MTRPRTARTDPAGLRAVSRHPAGRLDPERMLVAVVLALLEVEAGRRPLEQLAPVLSPVVTTRVRRTLERRRRASFASGRRSGGPGPGPDAVRAVSVTRPAPEVLEGAVAVRCGLRTTAVCVRLEAWRGTWRVTELARPEDRGVRWL